MFECVIFFVLVLTPIMELISHYELMAICFGEAFGKLLRGYHLGVGGEEGVVQGLLDCQPLVRVYYE